MAAVKGSDKEKRLASQFIAKFFNSFPTLTDQAIEAHFDLCEDDDVAVSVKKKNTNTSRGTCTELKLYPNCQGVFIIWSLPCVVKNYGFRAVCCDFCL